MTAPSKPVVFVLNGPNLNLLGTRDPKVYGAATLDDIKAALETRAKTLGLIIDFRQTNQEGDLVDWCQEAAGRASGLIINAGGYSHTSVAIRDAIEPLEIPVVEVHLSNIYARETFRRESLIAAVAGGTICGFGAKGYHFALEALAEKLT